MESEINQIKSNQADAFNNYFASMIDKISKNNVNNKANNEKVPTFRC
jgi:hypothetical protein